MNEERERVLQRWVEIVSVLILLGTATAMVVPKRGEMERSATAIRLLEDVETVRKAVYAFYSDSAYFPVQQAQQQLPAALQPYLPQGFGATRGYGALEYRNWPMAVRDTAVSAPNVVGLTVTVNDPRVGAAAESRARALAKFVTGNRFTFLFFGT